MSKDKKKRKKNKKAKDTRGDGMISAAVGPVAASADELLGQLATTTGATLGTLVNALEQLDASRKNVLDRLTALQAEINGYVDRFSASVGLETSLSDGSSEPVAPGRSARPVRRRTKTTGRAGSSSGSRRGR
jgi:molybdopterin converting factor small subunit